MLKVIQGVLFVFTIFGANLISAAPVIDSTSGVFTEGETIAITGNNFGTADAVPLVWDTVDNQFENTPPNNLKVPFGQGSTWGENTHDDAWGTDVVVSTDNPRSGRRTSYFGGKRSDLGWPNAIKDKKLNNIYVSWWFNPNIDPQNNGGSNKIIRIWDNPNGNDTRISWTTMHLQSTDSSTSWGSWGGNTGKWNRFEIWANSDTGELKTWVNGKLTHNKTDFVKKPSSHGFNVYLLGFDPSDSNKYKGFQFHMSDIYISPSIARVEISNKPNWNDLNSIREIQPISSWSNNKINITINKGSLNNLEGKYIYIINEKGEVNQTGFSICAKCPIAPSLGIE